MLVGQRQPSAVFLLREPKLHASSAENDDALNDAGFWAPPPPQLIYYVYCNGRPSHPARGFVCHKGDFRDMSDLCASMVLAGAAPFGTERLYTNLCVRWGTGWVGTERRC